MIRDVQRVVQGVVDTLNQVRPPTGGVKDRQQRHWASRRLTNGSTADARDWAKGTVCQQATSAVPAHVGANDCAGQECGLCRAVSIGVGI